MVNWAEDPGGEHINHLSHRYMGRDYQNPRTGRIKIQIEPLRVMGSIDDGGWRAFVPLTQSFIMACDGSLVDE